MTQGDRESDQNVENVCGDCTEKETEHKCLNWLKLVALDAAECSDSRSYQECDQSIIGKRSHDKWNYNHAKKPAYQGVNHREHTATKEAVSETESYRGHVRCL